MKKTATWNILLPLLLCLWTGIAQAETSAGMDVVLVLDSSGSMKRNDPKRMRVEAAKMFVTLLDEKDRVAVVSFSGKAETKANLLSLKTVKNEKQLLKTIENISASGAHTNIHDALNEGFGLLKRSKRKEKILVLMSDGKMDVGAREKDLLLLERTLDVLTPALARKNIKVYSIAFTENSYMPLLRLAAKDTNGHFSLLKTANGIHQVFENIFERSKNPDMLPLQEDSFIVDDSVNEITIVASKFRPNSVISLENPSGEDFNEENENPGVKWFNAKKFDLITIKNPAPGYWRIKFSEGGNKAYILTNLQLETETSKTEVQPGNPFQVQAWLQKGNKRITKRQVLNNTKFIANITYPDGHQDELKLTDDGTEIGSARHDGIYGNTFVFTNEGLHKIAIFTQGETFDREKAVFVTVKSLGMQTPFEIQDKPKAQPAQTEPTPEAVAETAPETMPAETAPKHGEHDASTDKIEIDSGGTKDTLHKVDETHDVKVEPLDDGHTKDATKEEPETDITSAIIAFLLLNIGIGGGIGGWLYYKKLKKKKEENTIPHAADNAIDLSDESDSQMPDPLAEPEDQAMMDDIIEEQKE